MIRPLRYPPNGVKTTKDEVEQNIVICQWRADWRDTNKSRHFSITEFNNCFIIQSPSLFLINILGKLPFLRKIDRNREKGVVSFTHQQNIFAAEHLSQTLGQTQLDDIAHKQPRNTGDGVVRVQLFWLTWRIWRKVAYVFGGRNSEIFT